MPFGPFALQWRRPNPNPPSPSPLPFGITRTYIPTPSGSLEVLSAVPPTPTSNPPIFFAHGGFGCAEVWLDYMQFFAARGYPCYAISYRGHGKSWYPRFWGMYFTTRAAMAEDLVSGVKWVEDAEKKRRRGTLKGRQEEEDVKVILVAHSAGGALSQYVLSRGMIKVSGFCMCAAVPGFGSFSVYRHWAPSVPFNFPYRLFHPRYLLATTSQIHTAFFTPSTPRTVVKHLQNLLSPYESMLWPLQTLFRFVTGPDVLSSITGWRLRSTTGTATPLVTDRLLVLAAEHDVLCTPEILRDAAKRYRSAFREAFRLEMLEGLAGNNDVKRLRLREDTSEGEEGVSFRVVKGVAHHLQNHVEWERGAKEILEWVGRL